MTDTGLGPFRKTGGLGTAGKTLFYKTDGTGRDSYIKSNNGGMTTVFSPVKWPEVGSFSTKKQYSSPSPAKPVPIVYYKSDGSGRDSYITASSGGFHPEAMGKRVDHLFLSTLRSSSPTNQEFFRRARDSRKDRSGSFSPSKTSSDSKMYKHQKMNTMRLSKPKHVREKVIKTDAGLTQMNTSSNLFQ
ncbi:unnamed protein product [Moneuplotes crassus]|uniref:Uncharacterized protein n=1 Tax=Euplotes crassus TaxID=5936 RepID=A0AAD1XXE3_EUPCR|nr:unnamed protein product [Moneuplotes crassus]